METNDMHKTSITTANLIDTLFNGQLTDFTYSIDKMIETGDQYTLLEMNKFLGNSKMLVFLINKIMCNVKTLESVLAESYYHENGFHKIVLLSGENFKVRLHHFGTTDQIPMENIHDHRWPFASTILSGRLDMDMFEANLRTDDAERLHHFIYDSDKSTGSYSTNYKGDILLNRTLSVSYYTGESYLMLPDELHRITNEPGQESITLIITGKPISKTCNLYAKRPILQEEKITNKYSVNSLCCMLNEITEKIFPQKN